MVFTQVILADQKSKIHGFELGFTTFLLRIKEYIHNYIIIYIYIYYMHIYPTKGDTQTLLLLCNMFTNILVEPNLQPI